MTLLDRLRRALGSAYEVERELGAGGMGVVFLAQDTRLHRPVAIKVLAPVLATAAGAERFIREARALARMAHPNVVVVHDVIAEPEGRDGLFYFVMEYLEGESLHHRLARGRLSPAEFGRLGADLLAGLAAVHQAGLIHRDIKPANIFFCSDGRAKLGDFGISRNIDGGESTTSSGARMAGTPDYFSPEQRRGETVDQRSDLYQAAAVLYEAVTGRRWSEVEAAPTRAWEGVPRRLRGVLRRGLAWDPRARWPDASSFGAALVAASRPRQVPPWYVVPVALLGVLLLWVVRPDRRPESPLPAVDLTVLRFVGPDSAAAHRLARYTSEPLDRFPRIVPRPFTVALAYPWPRNEREIAALRTEYFVEGEVRSDTLALSVYRSDGRLAGTIAVLRPLAALTPLVWGRSAADSIVARFFPGQIHAYRSVAGQGGSEDALAVDEFLLGEDAYHHDEYRLAERHYHNALDRDPGFALAGWHLLFARRALRETSTRDVRETLARFGAALPDLYRELLEVMIEEDLPTRFARYREVVTRYPDNRFARMLYADDLFHLGPLIGLPLDTARTELRRAAEIDPHRQLGPEQDHTIWVSLRLGREDDAWAGLRRRERTTSLFHAGPSREGADRTRFWRLALYERFSPWKAELVRGWFFRSPDSTRLRQTEEYMRLALSMDIPGCQLALGDIVSRHAMDDRSAALGYEAQGLALVALGRPLAALGRFDSATVRFGSAASRLEHGEWLLLLPVLGVPIPDSLAFTGEREVRLALQDRLLAPRAAWALAAAAQGRGEAPSPELLAILQRHAAMDQAASRLLRLVRSLEAARTGRLDDALALSDTLTRLGPGIRVGDPFARALLYLSRAQWQLRTGQQAQAIRTLGWADHTDLDGWAQGEAQPYDVDLALSPYTRLRMAAVLRKAGQVSHACALARRVEEIWTGAEPVLAGVRDSLASSLEGCRR